MDVNRLERLPGNSIAPLPSPQQRQTQWIIPGYTIDTGAIRFAIWGLLSLILLVFAIAIATTYAGIAQSWPIYIVIGLLLGGYGLQKLLQWQRYLRSNLVCWASAGELELDAYPLRLGARYRLTCRQTLMPRKPTTQSATWTLQLVCAETVTYGNSTQTSHERWILHRETIHQQMIPIGSSGERSIQCQFTLPSTGFPSLETEHNRIRWQIESTIDLAGEPPRDLSRFPSSGGLISSTARPDTGKPAAIRSFLTRSSEFVLWVDPKR